MTCAEVDDSAPGYALDILDPSHRSLVASHILRCRRCRDTVSRTQASADELLGFGPDAGPGPLGPDPVGPDPADSWDDPDYWVRPRRRMRVAATMAAVVALLVGTTLGPELEAASRPTPVPILDVALMADRATVGSVRMYAGQPPILQIDVTNLDGGGARMTLQADLVDASGRLEAFGSFRLTHGRGGWASTEPRDMPHPKSLILADTSGRVLAQAALS